MGVTCISDMRRAEDLHELYSVRKNPCKECQTQVQWQGFAFERSEDSKVVNFIKNDSITPKKNSQAIVIQMMCARIVLPDCHDRLKIKYSAGTNFTQNFRLCEYACISVINHLSSIALYTEPKEPSPIFSWKSISWISSRFSRLLRKFRNSFNESVRESRIIIHAGDLHL